MKSKLRGTPRPPPTFMEDIDIDAYEEEGDEECDNSPLDNANFSFDSASPFNEPVGTDQENNTIVRHIASFLTLSDAASMASMDRNVSHQSLATASHMGRSVPSWASFGVSTPDTPGLMALSPSEGGMLLFEDDDCSHSEDDQDLLQKLNHRRQQWVQQKLAQAVFSHPRSIRSFCLDAHKAAMEITKERKKEMKNIVDPETFIEPRKEKEQSFRLKIIEGLINGILHNVPLSVALDLVEALRGTALDTTFAVIQITSAGLNGIVSVLGRVVDFIWEIVSRFNPLALLDAIISMQFNYMGKTSEALVSGIQSVATGVESARNMARQRLSQGGGVGMMRPGGASSSSLHQPTTKSRNEVFNLKLLHKLSTLNSAAHVISYQEQENEALTRHAKKRVQRMMHYDVSLRPFKATVMVSAPEQPAQIDFPPGVSRQNSLDLCLTPSSETSCDSPFMCTPKSFPPTPGSRSLVLARGNRFADDVVFLARDKLRVEGGLDSENERTRAMAMALREGSRLAVFNAADVGCGIALSCGQHIATKVGNVLYCSTRSMVPILRNCFVYFEMSVLSPFDVNSMNLYSSLQTSMATLSIGLSTLEMPLNTLVGSWKGSVGIVTTGQILTAGQWCSPGDPPTLSAYGESATVGCLVCLDDGSAFETWDGVMVTATVTFNVNGCVVSPPAYTSPMAGAGSDPRCLTTPKELFGLPTLPLLVPMEEELFPTLTLHSASTQVMCRFSSEDIQAESRRQIGAPPGANVYAVDGSVLFCESDD